MVKADLIERAVLQAGLSRREAKVAVEAVFNTLSGSLLRGERVVVRGFGSFSVRARRTGMARNPRTGEPVPIPPGRVVRFRPGRDCLASD